MKSNSASSPLESQEAAALLQNPAALKGLLQSQETRQLIALLSQQGDLNAAAQQAKQGDVSGLQAMLTRLGQSAQGGKALSDLEERLGGK